MHISDGVLSGPVLTAGFAGTAILAGITMRKIDLEDIPKVSVITAVFFVASLIHVPVGITSVHLILNGLAGVVLGPLAFPCILLGLVLQAVLFGHGGITALGVNALMMGGGALVAYGVWQLRHYFSSRHKEAIFGAIAGGVGVVFSGIVLSLALLTTGKEFTKTAGFVLLAHIPIIIIEVIVTGATASYLSRVKPEILAGNHYKNHPKALGDSPT